MDKHQTIIRPAGKFQLGQESKLKKKKWPELCRFPAHLVSLEDERMLKHL